MYFLNTINARLTVERMVIYIYILMIGRVHASSASICGVLRGDCVCVWRVDMEQRAAGGDCAIAIESLDTAFGGRRPHLRTPDFRGIEVLGREWVWSVRVRQYRSVWR